MKIFTYYENCPTHNAVEELRLITLWREHWSMANWEPFVLGRHNAEAHPFFEEFNAAVAKLPTVNSREYELACYHRWLALAAVGGGFMADYDVFPATIGRAELPPPIRDETRLHIYQSRNTCPSLVYAIDSVAIEICKRFIAEKPPGYRDHEGRPHYSDMYALEDMVMAKSELIQTHDFVRDYKGSEGWQNAPFIHFSNSSMTPNKLTPRWKHIPSLVK